MQRILRQTPLAGTLTLLVLAGFMQPRSRAAFAGQDSNSAPQAHHSYSLASIQGNYAFVGTYAGLVAANLGVVTFDGVGSVKGSVIVNEPNPDGSRAIVKVGLTGTYTVQPDGTGKVSFVVTFSDGHTANVTEDSVITKAGYQHGTLIATSMFEAQEEPSVVLSGDVFVTHVYTRRPD